MGYDVDPQPDQTAELERAFINEFLENHGHTQQSLRNLPDAERHALLREATLFASMRLTEVESRAHYVEALHKK